MSWTINPIIFQDIRLSITQSYLLGRFRRATLRSGVHVYASFPGIIHTGGRISVDKCGKPA